MSNTIFFLYLLQKEFSALSLGDGGVESSTSLFAFLKRKQSVSQRSIEEVLVFLLVLVVQTKCN